MHKRILPRWLLACLVICLFTMPSITAKYSVKATYEPRFEWVRKNFANVGTYWGAKMMTITVTRSGSDKKPLLMATGYNWNPQVTFSANSDGSNDVVRSNCGFYMYQDSSYIFSFSPRPQMGIFSVDLPLGTTTYEVWVILFDYGWGSQWIPGGLPLPPALFTEYPYMVFNQVPKLAFSDFNGNGLWDGIQLVDGSIGTLPVSGIAPGGGVDLVPGGSDTPVDSGNGSGSQQPAVWEYGVVNPEDVVDIRDLAAGNTITVGTLYARYLSGKQSPSPSVQVRFFPEDFYFFPSGNADSRTNPAFAYDLMWNGELVNVQTPSHVWGELSQAMTNLSPVTIRYSRMVDNKFASPLSLPAQTYETNVRIEFVTGE